MGSTSLDITGNMCSLCTEFLADLYAYNSQPSADGDRDHLRPSHGRWQSFGSDPETSSFLGNSWGTGFRHHDSLAALEESSSSCDMCRVLFADLSELSMSEEAEVGGGAAAATGQQELLCEGWLGLYPWWSQGWVGENRRKGHFRAGFRKGLAKMKMGSGTIGAVPLHTFRVCRRMDVEAENGSNRSEGAEEDVFLGSDITPAIPSTLTPVYIAKAVEKWRRKCLDEHETCAARYRDQKHSLPTRVLDLGDDPDACRVRLYETDDEIGEYVALSHCWGGAIPAVTTQVNIQQRFEGLNIAELPRNFQDAIHVTRALGVRYLSIDALCIIQDSQEDWFFEAGRMASLYAGAKVVVSALESAASTAGFLHPKRLPRAVIDEHYAVEKSFPHVYDYLKACPLTTRAWCMQERLLAPAILHIGKEQMFWECLKYFNSEVGGFVDGSSTGEVMGKFIALRVRLGSMDVHTWNDWYGLVEEYTTRNLTVSSDKLPALAGAAALFRNANETLPSPTYLAGLWKEDLGRGLLWGAHYAHYSGRRVWGYQPSDECVELMVPPQEYRAPSWSWASLDGAIDHWSLRIGTGENWFDVLEVTMEKGENDPTAAQPLGSIRINGPLEQVKYLPNPDKGSVGSLEFADELTPAAERGEVAGFGGCVLDMDRGRQRDCWALVACNSNNDRYILVLEDRGDGTFKRVGFCTAYDLAPGGQRFARRDVVIR